MSIPYSDIVFTPNFLFYRITNKIIKDDEEVRYDIPTNLTGASIYIGVAADGTATSSALWTVVRYYFDANDNPNRARVRKNVVWTDRTLGW